MKIVPLTIDQADAYLNAHERHYKTTAVQRFAIGLSEDGKLRGAVIVGVMDGDAQLAHIYCDGVSEGYTLLYGAAWRAAKALGYTRMIL